MEGHRPVTTKPHKEYGRFPRELRPHIPALVDELKAVGQTTYQSYAAIARAFGVSASRVQQIDLSERRVIKEEERRAVIVSLVEGTGGDGAA